MGFAIELTDLRKTYGNFTALEGLSFSIEEGEIFALLGPNGAGKSTAIGMISGLTRITSGSIKIFGHDNQRESQITRSLTGVMPQEIVVDNFFKIGESLKLHSGYFGLKDDRVWREKLIDRLALGPYLNKKPIECSGGTKRRHMLAKALIHKPKLLILDEPTAGVDVELRRSIWGFVREMNKNGTTVILTTHYLEEAEEMCERFAFLAKGKLVALDKREVLFDKSKGESKSLEDIFIQLTSEDPNGKR